MCDVYVHGCEHDPKLAVKDLFAFLDGRVESMGQTDLNTKIKSINAELNIPDDDDDDDDNDDEWFPGDPNNFSLDGVCYI